MGLAQSCDLDSSTSFGALSLIIPLHDQTEASKYSDENLNACFKYLKEIALAEIDLNEKYLTWADGQRRKVKLPLLFGQLDQKAFLARVYQQGSDIMKSYVPNMIQIARILRDPEEVEVLEKEIYNLSSIPPCPDNEVANIDLQRIDLSRLKTAWTLEIASRILTALVETEEAPSKERVAEMTKLLQSFQNMKALRPQLQDASLARLDPLPTVASIVEWGFNA